MLEVQTGQQIDRLRGIRTDPPVVDLLDRQDVQVVPAVPAAPLRDQELSAYFTTGGASGPLDEGATVTWDFEFEPLDPGSTMVRIREGTWPESQDGLDRSYGNFMGWTNMIACMKTHVEHGLDLREGFFT